MLKLKILNKPKTLKLKCTSKFPEVVLANLQEKTIESSIEQQIVQADKPYDGLSKVTVEPYTLEEKVVTPSKETQEVLPSNSNGLSKVVVKGDENLTADNIRQGASIFGVEGTMLGAWDTSQIMQTRYMFYNNKTMVEAPYLNTENVTNASYMFSGCSVLETIPDYNTSKVTNLTNIFSNCSSLKVAPNFDTQNVTDMSYMFSGCSVLETIPDYNTSKVTNLTSTFQSCRKLKTFPNFDTQNVTNFYNMCGYCSELETIPLLNWGKANNLVNPFSNCSSLTNLGGFFELGKSYTIKRTYASYTLDLSVATKLTYESLMNVINNLYDLNLSYNVAGGGTLYTQNLTLGATNIAKLTTADEIAIATNKGWTVS